MQTQIEIRNSEFPYISARIIELWCAEPVFFASRELSDTYYTEGTIGNYALAYALGWSQSPYRLVGEDTGRPTYIEDLAPLANRHYILPAWPLPGALSFRFERFNGLTDSYWFAMSQNRVATAREEMPFKREGMNVRGFRASNFPQTGRLRMIARGSRFQTIVLGGSQLPEYIRVGKFMSKVKIRDTKELRVEILPHGDYTCDAYLNSADMPKNVALINFDLISIPPASLLKNLKFRGAAWKVGDTILPASLNFCGDQI